MNSAAFIDAQGRGKHSWPRTLGTLGLMVAAAAAIIIPLRAVVLPWLSANADDMPEPVRSGILALSAGLIFGGALAGLFLGVRWLHARGARTLLTAAPRFRWAQLALGFGLSAAMVGGASWLLDPASVKPLSSVDPRALAFGALALLVGFSIQSSAEEILFRGYILQVARRGLRSRWAAALLSIALFTLVHVGYGIEAAIFSLTSAVGITICVLLLDGLEFAIGAHIANNFIVALLFEELSNANAPSVSGIAWEELAANGVIMAVLVAVALLLRRRPVSLSATAA